MSTEAIDIKITAQRDVSIGEFVGRDKIVNNIEHIYERALTAVEEAAQEKSAEAAYLAAGVTAFIQSMKDRATEGSSAKRGNPYKGLLEYRLSDAQFFFGRSRAIEDLLERMGQGPLAVLHAQSGAGKSSLLQAGISSVLIANGHLPVYLRPYNVEPSLALKRAFLSDPGQAPLLATAPLRDFLRQVTGVLGPQTTLYIFLDQFEEFFTQLEEPARAEFVRELAECLEDESLNVRWLLSMRAEFFGNLANFRPRIRNPFQNDYRLRRMTRAEAQEAAEAPAARRGIHYEPGLIDQILDDLGKSAVHPPEIQLVCSALYEELKPGEMVITRAMYEAAGKAEGILSGHLERVLSRDLPPEQRPVAQRLLEALITSDNRRVLRTRAELLAELASSGIAPEALDAVLTQLIDSRLLRVQETNVEPEKSGEERDDKAYEAAPGLNRGQVTQLAYELAHDYLLGRITLDPAVQARKAAQELLAQEVYAYKRFGTLMSADKLDIVEVRRAELALTPEAEELIRKSAHKLRRQRQFVMGGLGVVIILVLFIIAAAFTAFQASQERAMAISTQQAAQTAAVESLSLQVVSEQRAEAASTQRAEAQSQQATSQALSTQALINAQTAQDSAATAAARAELANAVVETLFDNNGLVPVGAGPWDFAFDGTWLWVSNDLNDTVQAIDPATGAVQQTLPVGNRPGALAFDAQRQALWVVNQGDDLLQAIDVTSGRVVARVATANRPAALLHDGTRLWVTNYSNNTIQAVDPGSGRRIGQPLPVGNLPWAMAFDGKRVWVANRNGDSLSVIDTLLPAEAITATDVSTVSLAGTPGGLVFDGNWMWVSLQDRQEIQAFNPDTRQPVITLTVGVRPTALGFDGAYLWVANQGDNTVQAVDRVAGTVSAPIPVGRLPRAFMFTGQTVWVANFSDNTVQAIDRAAGNVAAFIKVGRTPRGLAFDGARLWIINSAEGQVQSIDPDTGRLGDPVQVGRGPRDITFDPDHNLIWVANTSDNSVQAVDPVANQSGQIIQLAPTGLRPRAIIYTAGRLWVANEASNNVQAIDPVRREVVETIPVGRTPFDLTSDGKRIWVVNNGDNQVQAITPGRGEAGVPIPVGSSAGSVGFDGTNVWVTNFNDGTVQIIEPDTGQISDPIQVGSLPVELAFDGQKAWVVNFGDNTIQAVDPSTHQAGKPVHVCAGPTYLLFAEGKGLWVSCRDSNAVQHIVINR